MHVLTPFAALAAFSAPLVAQDDFPRVRIELGLGAGHVDHNTENSTLDGDTAAGMFRIGLEAFGSSGLGGGVRYESWTSDDDLFNDAGFPDVEAHTGSLFAHLSYRFTGESFQMPLRGGLLLSNHQLDDGTADEETDFTSLGFLVEVAPEIYLTRSQDFRWSLFGSLGLGAGVTEIESDALAVDFDSSTAFFGLDIGTRLGFGAFEAGLSYVIRTHEMDQSDPESSLVVFGYDSTFDGVMLTLGVVF